MIPEIIATLVMVVKYLRTHPELAETLLTGLLKALRKIGIQTETETGDFELERKRGLASGIARERAEAVQAYMRNHSPKETK